MPTQHTVPRVVHHIWADTPPADEPIPAWVTDVLARWDADWLPAHPGWTRVLHTTASTRADPTLAPFTRTAARYHLPHRGLSDLLRWKILHTRGGVYLDIDTIPVDLPALTDHPNRNPNGVMCTSGPPTKHTLDQWGMALPPHSPLPRAVLLLARDQLLRGVRNEHHVAGPVATRKAFDQLPLHERPTVLWNCGYVGYPPAARAALVADPAALRRARPHAPLVATS